METVIVGTLSITARDELFTRGYRAGYERYLMVYKHSALSDNGVYAFLSRTVNDLTNQDRYNAGFITGWYAAMFGQGDTPMQLATEEGKQETILLTPDAELDKEGL